MKRTVVLLIIAVFILASCGTNDPRHSGSDITTTANITTSEDSSLQGDITDGKAAGTSESTNAADDITDDPIKNPDQIDVTSLSGYKAFITGFEGTLGTKLPFNLISEFEYSIGKKDERVVLDGDDIEKEKTIEYNGKVIDLRYQYTLIGDNGHQYHYYTYIDHDYVSQVFGRERERSAAWECSVYFDENQNICSFQGSAIGRVEVDNFEDGEALKKAVTDYLGDRLCFDKFNGFKCSYPIGIGRCDLRWFYEPTEGIHFNDNWIQVSVFDTGYIGYYSYRYEEENDHSGIDYPLTYEETVAIARNRIFKAVEEAGWSVRGWYTGHMVNTVLAFMHEGKPAVYVGLSLKLTDPDGAALPYAVDIGAVVMPDDGK